MFRKEDYAQAAEYILDKSRIRPLTGIILGTGLGQLVDSVSVDAVLDYASIPHFPVSTVESHSGRLVLGTLNKHPVVVMQGRFHYYEGYSMALLTFPVRVMKLLGIKDLLITNASGGLNESFEASDLMIIEDHINLLPENPLTGQNLSHFGPRFPDMFATYEPDLVNKAKEFCVNQGIRAHSGVYAAVSGPNLETPAEYRYLRRIGADAVGMSTVPEIIVARHCGIRCFALSVITDLCYEPRLKATNIDEILNSAYKAQPAMSAVLAHLCSQQ